MAFQQGVNYFSPIGGSDTTAGVFLTNEFGHAMLIKSALAGAAPATTTDLYAKGCYYIDTTQTTGTSPVWINVGTSTSPTWVQEVSVSSPSSTGTGVVRTAHMKYDFAVDGGAVSTITPVLTAALPINSIILGGVINITTSLTSGGSATIALGTTAGSSTTALKGATAVASWTSGVTLPLVPVFTAATFVKMTAAGSLDLTVATAALTAGVFEVIVQYVVGLA